MLALGQLAGQSVEHVTLDLGLVSSSPTLGREFALKPPPHKPPKQKEVALMVVEHLVCVR